MGKREEGMVLAIVLREMCAYGEGWRLDWDQFDGRVLLSQLDALRTWAEGTLAQEGGIIDYAEGRAFEQSQATNIV